MKKKKEPPKPTPPGPRKEVVESFLNPTWELSGLSRHTTPSCFNGMVKVRKYRVTVEMVEEPVEVIQARLIELWETCDNHHHWTPLQAEAARYGLDLSPYSWGCRREKK